MILNINQTLFILLQYFSSKLVSLIMFKLQFPGYVQRRGQVKSEQLNPKITIAYFKYLMITLLTLSNQLLQQCQPSSWSWGGQTPKRAKEWWRGRRVRMFPFGAAKKYKKKPCIFELEPNFSYKMLQGWCSGCKSGKSFSYRVFGTNSYPNLKGFLLNDNC